MKNIENLEKLSCLKLNNESKEYINESLDDILNLIEELKSTEFKFKSEQENMKNFGLKNNYKLINKNKSITGIHLEERGFLSPKVIKK